MYSKNSKTNGVKDSKPAVIVCCLISRKTSFAFDRFLSNQNAIQKKSPDTYLVLATDEPDFIDEITQLLHLNQINGEVILFKTIKPAYAQSRLWIIAAGREALRRYTLEKNADFILMLDSDMTFDPSLVELLLAEIGQNDVLFCGYPDRNWNTLTYGAGCLLIRRTLLKKIRFRCIEFKNGVYFQEDELFEIDSFEKRARIKKGIFAANRHYRDSHNFYDLQPHKTGWLWRFTTRPLFRYILLKLEILLKVRLADRYYIHVLRKKPV